MSDIPQYVLDRLFNAPVDMVWRAWTDPELLQRWYGPGVETIIHKFDLKPGGEWRNEMKWGEKSDLSKIVFKEVIPNEKLVWHHSSADADWNVVKNPMMADWPQTLLTTVTFTPVDGKTNVRLVWVPLDPSEAESACFAAAVNNMGKGWEAGYAIMDQMFKEMQASTG